MQGGVFGASCRLCPFFAGIFVLSHTSPSPPFSRPDSWRKKNGVPACIPWPRSNEKYLGSLSSAADKIKVPGAQLFTLLVQALRRSRPTELADETQEDVFARMCVQQEAIQELRVWRSARQMVPEPVGCPPTPRVRRHDHPRSMVRIRPERHHFSGFNRRQCDSFGGRYGARSGRRSLGHYLDSAGEFGSGGWL
jgi:hypothetical protein